MSVEPSGTGTEQEEWAKLSEAVTSVKYKKQKGSISPTVGVTFCLLCGSPLYFVKGNPSKGQREWYRCHGNKSKGIDIIRRRPLHRRQVSHMVRQCCHRAGAFLADVAGASKSSGAEASAGSVGR
ncbi:hypothetical protein ACWEQO_10045 [Streptomyces sp. NPDC004051]